MDPRVLRPDMYAQSFRSPAKSLQFNRGMPTAAAASKAYHATKHAQQRHVQEGRVQHASAAECCTSGPMAQGPGPLLTCVKEQLAGRAVQGHPRQLSSIHAESQQQQAPPCQYCNTADARPAAVGCEQVQLCTYHS